MPSTSNIASCLFNKSKKRTNNSSLITDRKDEIPDDSISGANNEMDIDHEQKSTNVVHSVLKKARSNKKMVFNLSRINYLNPRRKLRPLLIINTRFHINTIKQPTRKYMLHWEESIPKYRNRELMMLFIEWK